MCLLYTGLAVLFFSIPWCPADRTTISSSHLLLLLPPPLPTPLLQHSAAALVDQAASGLPPAAATTGTMLITSGGTAQAVTSLVAAASVAAAQHVTPYVNPAVPTGVPVPGNYTGPLRPRVHFTPPQHFMNDPNGMFVDADGLWHVYYQYNPTGLVAGNQHWGHATSRDLYHWDNQPIAIFPPQKTVYAFSGSIVVDSNNTSGLFPAGKRNGVVAMLTLAEYRDDGSAGPQTQALAYSNDGGYTFEYYDRNPVIDSTSSQFRDPKVFWYEPTGHWVMVLAYSQEFAVGIFTSTNLHAWTPVSNFTGHGLLGTQFECPGLVKMPVRDRVGGAVIDEAWVMLVSVQPGAPLGGSVTQYFPGRFNGTHFVPFDAATRLTDFAKDNYAAQYFDGLPDGANAVNMGWANNWAYAQSVPTGQLEGWRGGFTLPRANYLTRAPRIGWTMVDEIHGDLAPVRGTRGVDVNGQDCHLAENESRSMDVAAWSRGSYLIEANVTGIDLATLSPDASLKFTLSSPSAPTTNGTGGGSGGGGGGDTLSWGMFFAGDMPFFIDRGRARGLFEENVFFTDKFSAADVWDTNPGAVWRMRAVVDRSIFEVFVDSGIHAATVLIFPRQPLTVLEIRSNGLSPGAKVSIAVDELRDAWNDRGPTSPPASRDTHG